MTLACSTLLFVPTSLSQTPLWPLYAIVLVTTRLTCAPPTSATPSNVLLMFSVPLTPIEFNWIVLVVVPESLR